MINVNFMQGDRFEKVIDDKILVIKLTYSDGRLQVVAFDKEPKSNLPYRFHQIHQLNLFTAKQDIMNWIKSIEEDFKRFNEIGEKVIELGYEACS